MFLRSLPANPQTAPAAQVDPLLAFVSRIGLEVREQPLPQATFLPGLLLEGGALVVDRARLLYPGDILHEAGHLALAPAAERPLLGGDIGAQHPERAGDELGVLAWTYAAARELGIAAAVVFHPAGYKGDSEYLIAGFEGGNYLGLPLLVWMGLTTTADFPRMTRWLRE